MMRRPTPHDVAYAWHRDAILGVYGDGLPTHDTPQCGYYKRKLVKGGPFVPARIWLDAEIDDATGELLSDETLQCEVNGQWADPEDAWQWLCSNPITEDEFNYMVAVRFHCAWHAPSEPQANPRAAINWLRASPPIFRSSTGKENL